MLEVCVEDSGGLREALSGGAGRIELCSALALGGLTPSASFMSAAVRGPVPIHVLIRPRAGDFLYDAAEEAVMAGDIRDALDSGAAGIAIGASRPDTQLDTPLLERLIGLAREAAGRRGRPVSLTLHRVFDLCRDPSGALEAAITLGFDRILTSGGAGSALAGCETLATLVKQARRRIRILAASGIDASNVARILAAGVDEIHASCQTALTPPDPRLVEFGFAPAQAGRTSAATVRALAAAIDAWRSHTS